MGQAERDTTMIDTTGYAKRELTAYMGKLLTEHGIDHILRAFAAACRTEGESVLVRHADMPSFARELQAICERNATRLDACNHGNAALFASTCE